MSLANIYPYFRARMNALEYREHEDGFSRDNIPSSLLNESYHILTSSGVGGSINQNHQDVGVNVNLMVAYKGFRHPSDAKEKALVEIDKILKEICNIKNRTSSLLNVVFDGFDMVELDVTNDNVVMVEMNFTADVVLDMR